MNWSDIIITLLTVFFGSGGLLVMLLNQNRTRDAHNRKIDETLETLSEAVRKTSESLKYANEILSQNRDATLKQMKYTITRLHNEIRARGSITPHELECAEDIYKEYISIGGNSFIETLMQNIRRTQLK